MSTALRGFFFILLFALITVLQWNLDSDKTATRQLKNALELAVHDASLALDETQLSQGYIVFDQAQAELNFRQSLSYNLKLNNDLTPVSGSFYKQPFKIDLLQYFDDKTPDPNNPSKTISFPYVYSNAKYDVLEVLNGPCVVAVVETKSPRYFKGTPTLIRQAAVYEYKY